LSKGGRFSSNVAPQRGMKSSPEILLVVVLVLGPALECGCLLACCRFHRETWFAHIPSAQQAAQLGLAKQAAPNAKRKQACALQVLRPRFSLTKPVYTLSGTTNGAR
jgi:hypothetical protein